MGRDKLDLEVGGVPLIRRVYDVLARQCEEVLVVGPERCSVLPAEVRYVSDLRPGFEGPLAGMEAGFLSAQHPLVFVAAGDMPFLPEKMVGYLLGHVAQGDLRAAIPRWKGIHPLCAAYERGILPLVQKVLDDGVRAVRGMLESIERVEYFEEELTRFGDPDTFLMNVNTMEDLERARSG